jgi:hypothetical protein
MRCSIPATDFSWGVWRIHRCADARMHQLIQDVTLT